MTTTTTDIKQALRSAAGRLPPVWPSPTEIEALTRETADAAVDGVLMSCFDSKARRHFGRSGIDWANLGPLSVLCRMTFIGSLAAAYHVLRDERYAEAARDYMADWMAFWTSDQNKGKVEAEGSLGLCGRNAVWAGSLHLFLDSPAFDAAFVARVVAFVEGQYDWLRHHLSTTINWRIFEANSLLQGSLYLDFLDKASDWQRFAVSVLNDGWHRQFLSDGVHEERNPVYHCGMTGTYHGLLKLAGAFPELGLCMTAERMIPSFDFLLACTKPNGYLCGLNDSQTAYTGHRRDGVHTEGQIGMDGEAIWRGWRGACGLPTEYPATSQVFPEAGLAFLRSGWNEDAAWMSFDGSGWGGGHCHLGRNAIQLHALRQSMVVDSNGCYNADQWRYLRSTRAHSTCNLNGFNQSTTNPNRLRAHHAPGYDAVFSVYEGGYWDLDHTWSITHAAKGIWAQHARILFWVQDRFAFVADSLFRLPHRPDDPEADRPSFECVWQLAPEAEISLQPDRNRAVAQWKDAGLLVLTPIRPEGSRFETYCGATDPLRGYVGIEKPAPQIVLNTPRMERRHDYYVSVLVPFGGRQAPEVAMEAKSPMGQVGYVRLRWADGTADEIHWGCNFGLMLGPQPDFETDSSLVHLRKDAAGKAVGGCCVHGTYIAPFDTTVRAQPETFRFGATV
jgi:hypothetical protein